MPGYRVRVVRNEDQKVIYDSGGSEARISCSVFDNPGPGNWTYYLQVLAVGSKDANFLTYENAIGLIKLNR